MIKKKIDPDETARNLKGLLSKYMCLGFLLHAFTIQTDILLVYKRTTRRNI